MIVYGVNPVLEALKAGRVSRVRIGPKGLARLHAAGAGRLDAVLPAMSSRLADVVRAARDAGVEVDVVDSAEIERAARGGVHQGVVADVADRDEDWTPASLVAAAAGPALIVVLDGIEDPHNVGAILRSADAAGVDGVVRQTRHAARLDGAAAKASAGAVAHVRIANVVNVARAIEELEATGVWTVGLAGESGEPYDDVDLTLPSAIVVGSEGAGLRRLVRERCDRLVRIPMHGQVSSLNASVAASVMLFEARRQRRRGGARS
jgi:23S rRNA (guanosine2251-2'-O)-methyltransferase